MKQVKIVRNIKYECFLLHTIKCIYFINQVFYCPHFAGFYANILFHLHLDKVLFKQKTYYIIELKRMTSEAFISCHWILLKLWSRNTSQGKRQNHHLHQKKTSTITAQLWLFFNFDKHCIFLIKRNILPYEDTSIGVVSSLFVTKNLFVKL